MSVLQAGVTIDRAGTRFTVVSHHAESLHLCLYDETGTHETARHEMQRAPGARFTAHIADIKPGQRYAYRASGPWQPEHGHRFDPSKLLIDPYTTRLDRPFKYHADLSEKDIDTAARIPKAILESHTLFPAHTPIIPAPGGLIYEVCVKAFSILHPVIEAPLCGTLAALAHPAAIAHFKKLGVTTLELMPITAWIDERHLKPHGLSNAWGYNPVVMMALDPRLAPNGIADLRRVADALHKEDIALVLDVVFNHTGESDQFGPVLSMRGLDNALYYRHHQDEPGALINDTGTGNTLAVDKAPVRDLVLDTMRHFVSIGGVDGFRFDLCTVLGRTEKGFSLHAPLFEAMRHDPLLSKAMLIAEPWDIGPGGYQLGQFPPQFLEWNDRYRDDLRRFWRGDQGTLSALATRLSGSADIFGKQATHTRSVNFLAAHDGFTLADLAAYKRKHNEPNGENDRDGHTENFSWNHGTEGRPAAPAVEAKRIDDIKAMLALLFVSRGTPLLSAGDEFARTQNGNNNAYAQDNETTWLNWQTRNQDLEDFTAALSALRQKHRVLNSTSLLSGLAPLGFETPDITWLRADGTPMQSADWEQPTNHFLGLILSLPPLGNKKADQIAILINRSEGRLHATLPPSSKTKTWQVALATKPIAEENTTWAMPPSTVAIFDLR